MMSGEAFLAVADHTLECGFAAIKGGEAARTFRMCTERQSLSAHHGGEAAVPPIKMIEIRNATDADKPAVWEIIREVIATGDSYVFAPDSPEDEMIAYWFSSEKYVYVAEENGEVVGTFWLKANQPGLGSHVCNAAYMVAPNAAGKGIGRKMAEFSLDEARRLGFTAMQFNFVVASNTAAVRLWKSIGMEVIGEIPDAFDHARDGMTNALIMYRKL